MEDEKSNPLLRWLAIGFAMLTVWMIFAKTVFPFIEHRRASRERIEKAEAATETAREHIRIVEAKERHAAEIAAARVNEREAQPAGSPMTWLYARIAPHFERRGLGPVALRVNSEADDTDSADYVRTYWAVQLALPGDRDGMMRALAAVDDIMRNNMFVELLALEIRPDVNEKTGRLMMVTVSTVTKK